MSSIPDDAISALCGAACRGRTRQVETLLSMHPELVHESVHAAAVLGDARALAAHLAADPAQATAAGPGGRSPLPLACSTRYREADAAAAARLLLAHGADANDGLSFFVAFEAERVEILEALLEAGAELDSAVNPRRTTPLHFAADACWKPDLVRWLLERGADPNARVGAQRETVLHTAVRRRRLDAVDLLLEHGAEIDARTAGGMTAWRHALRRSFDEVTDHLALRGADSTTSVSDRLAVALMGGDLGAATELADAHPEMIPALPPEEARLLPDLAGRNKLESVCFLLDRGADIEARGLDGGTSLQQCGWFGVPDVARVLLARGADVHAGGCEHGSTPLGWAVHGSRYSGGAAGRQAAYLALVDLYLDAGATLELPGDPPGEPGKRMLTDASPQVAERLRERSK